MTVISTELAPRHLERAAVPPRHLDLRRKRLYRENQERDFSVPASPPVEMTEADRTVSSTTRVISTGVAQPRSGEI